MSTRFILQFTVFYFADESKSHFVSFFPLLITNPSQPIVIYSIQTVLGSWCHLVAENCLNQPRSSKVSSFLEKFCITQCHCFPLFFFLYLTCTINNFFLIYPFEPSSSSPLNCLHFFTVSVFSFPLLQLSFLNKIFLANDWLAYQELVV